MLISSFHWLEYMRNHGIHMLSFSCVQFPGFMSQVLIFWKKWIPRELSRRIFLFSWCLLDSGKTNAR